jgi:3-deoxy-D-manno-octulosonic acid (KDO) 8-phosphate synthase
MRLAGFEVGPQTPLFLIAGPRVIESEQLAPSTAERGPRQRARFQKPNSITCISR